MRNGSDVAPLQQIGLYTSSWKDATMECSFWEADLLQKSEESPSADNFERFRQISEGKEEQLVLLRAFFL